MPRQLMCRINHNTATTDGGGLYLFREAYNLESIDKVANCEISNNNSMYHGGMMAVRAKVINSTLVKNTSDAAVSSPNQGNSYINSVLWGNSQQIEGSNNTYKNCAIQGGHEGTNITNLQADNDGSTPGYNYVKFLDPENETYRPATGSALINAGDNAYVEGSYDLAGKARVYEDYVDIGAYESNCIDYRYFFAIAGSQYDFYGRTLTESGYYQHQWTPSGHACDSLVTVYLSICDNQGNQETALGSGWNWFSSFIDQSAGGFLNRLQNSLGDKALIIKSQTQFTSYISGTWSGNLNTLENEKMYMIQTNAATQAALSGCLVNPSDYPVTLHNGWNWIGFVSPNNIELNTALAGLSVTPQDGDIIKSYSNGFAVYYTAYNIWFGSLLQLEAGKGYMFKSGNSSDVTLTYPDAGRNSDLKPLDIDYHWITSNNLYSDNMTFIAEIALDGNVSESDTLEIGAFCNGEQRGATRAIYVQELNKYLIFMTIYGNNGDEMSFSLYDHSAKRELDVTCNNVIYFSANESYGSMNDAYMFSFNNLYTDVNEDELMSRSLVITPNPVKKAQKASINYAFTQKEMAGLVVEVYNSLGVKVKTFEPQSYPFELQEIGCAGTYMIKIITGTGNVVIGRVIVM